METKGHFEITRMSLENNIPIFKIRFLLGIEDEKPLSFELLSAEDAKNTYENAFPGSEYAKGIMAVWEKLSLAEAENAVTIEEAESAYDNAPPKSQAQTLAHEKWDALCLDMVNAATKPEEALEMFNAAPQDSKSEAAACKKYVELCLDFQSMCDFFQQTPIETDYEAWAFEKALELVSHGYEAELLYNAACGIGLQSRAIKKRLDLAVNIEEANAAWKMAPEDSEIEVMCVRKLATFYGYEENQA